MLIVQTTNYRTTCSCRFLSLQQCQYFGREEREKQGHPKGVWETSAAPVPCDPGIWTALRTGLFCLLFNTYLRSLGVSLLQCAEDTQLFLSSAADVLSRCLWDSEVHMEQHPALLGSRGRGCWLNKNMLQEFDFLLASTHCPCAVIGTLWKVLPKERLFSAVSLRA